MTSITNPAADGTAIVPRTARSALRRAWTFLLIAAVFEVVFALSAKGSNGFTELVPSLITVGAGAVGIFLLSLALRMLDVGVGYAVWTGIGSVGTVIIGSVLFDEAITWRKWPASLRSSSGCWACTCPLGTPLLAR